MKLPPLEIRKAEKDEYSGEYEYEVDVLFPGIIEASAAHESGKPCIKDARVPTHVLWPPEYLNRADLMALKWKDIADNYCISILDAVIGTAFNMGVQWQKSKKRRKRMDEAVEKLWKEVIPSSIDKPESKE